VTDEGEKTKSPPGPTVTSTVVALAALGYNISEVAAVIRIITRKEKAFMV
jgi:Holliday junction resolvasome RuvABC DNA-binding subunit